MSPRQKKILYRDRSVGLAASALLHAMLLAGGGVVFAQGAQYAVQAGAGGLEVDLVAALPEPAEAFEVPVEAQPVPASVSSDEMALPQEPKPLSSAPTPPSPAAATPERGDGSSPVPGRDQTTLRSEGGALTEARPNYLRNPAPPYPYQARQNGWEGVVLLRAAVDRTGQPTRVELEASSGYDVLDQSALKAVRRWKFNPARLGALPVESMVRIPVRFQLDNKS